MPSSWTSKSSFLRSAWNCPLRFRTMTSELTRLTDVRNVGDGAASPGCCRRRGRLWRCRRRLLCVRRAAKIRNRDNQTRHEHGGETCCFHDGSSVAQPAAPLDEFPGFSTLFADACLRPPPRRDRRRRRNPSADPKVTNPRFEPLETLPSIFGGNPGIGVQRFGLSPERLYPVGIASPLGNARLELRIACPQSDELVPTDCLFDG